MGDGKRPFSFMRLCFLFKLLQVEFQFLALENVAVSATALTRRRGDLGEETARREVLLKLRLDLGGLSSLDVLLGGLLRALLIEHSFVLLGQLKALLATKWESIVSLVPLTEWRAVDLHDGALGERLRTHELVVAGVVHNIDDSRLSGDAFGAP